MLRVKTSDEGDTAECQDPSRPDNNKQLSPQNSSPRVIAALYEQKRDKRWVQGNTRTKVYMESMEYKTS